MNRSFYRNTERVLPSASGPSAILPAPPYEQPFPGYEDDYLYFSRLYPMTVRKYVVPVRNAFDRMEYSGSLLFDRYPDRDALNRIADGLLDGNKTERDLLLMLMMHELMRRRERYRNTHRR